jgi:hypothetical protein
MIENFIVKSPSFGAHRTRDGARQLPSAGGAQCRRLKRFMTMMTTRSLADHWPIPG